MNQNERRQYLIETLLKEEPSYRTMQIPSGEEEQKLLLRALLNVRLPREIGEEFLEVQDAYLQEETRKKGITDLADLTPVSDGIYLWQGDITTLKCDAIVNAANSGMTGCYVPNHRCMLQHHRLAVLLAHIIRADLCLSGDHAVRIHFAAERAHKRHMAGLVNLRTCFYQHARYRKRRQILRDAQIVVLIQHFPGDILILFFRLPHAVSAVLQK